MLVALGEQDPSASEAGHLHGCDSCAADLDAARATVAVGRGSRHVRDLPEPPPELWARIAGAAFAAPALAPPAARPAVRTRWFDSLRGPRGRLRLAVAATAALVLIVAVGVGAVRTGRRGVERVVAEADLIAQPAAPAAAKGRAAVVDTGHGLEVRLEMSGMPTPGGYYLVWLYDGGSVMVPLGAPGSARLNVPAAAGDLTRFSIIDVSAQQLGQQQHGTSMLQGRLRP
ncbi:anti-sigma factor domain-containing protein [Pilimelia terevasa]|uniref:anti-sigma factor domain-containing protein n=1 Tax=Pilimelia terevasa TaxID=53372 RepID=UPI001E3FB549|nr:anti-sigma factor [Pilimelia terevasa]